MSEQQFPTQSQIERRADHIIGGLGYPYLPALPGIVFRRLTLGEKGEASRAFSRALKEEMASGARFSDALVMTELRRRCHEVGIDYDELMAREEEFQRRIYDLAPADLAAEQRLTDEEVAAMPDEDRESYLAQLKERGQRIMAFFANLFTPEEKIVRGQIEQVKLLKAQLQQETYEHHARIRERLVEILRGARREVEGESADKWPPYFSSLEELYDLGDTDRDTWLQLADKWKHYKAGLWPGFTRQSSSIPGNGNA